MRGKISATAIPEASRFSKVALACLAGVLGLTLAAVSCGSHQSGDCKGQPGEEFCACNPSGGCNPGLACAGDLNQCLLVAGSDGPPSAGTNGGGNSTGAGGTAGTGTTGTGAT